ncbi:MAG: imidazole glycerol phosphate synthase subunit HisH [Ghiorsea sp.]|nr:imidazole glycerol phosphate synthase subunit HisH [Ghiorsea sp.]
MIGLVDYGMGNLHSVTKALEKVGGEVKLVQQAEDIANYERIVLPGVGAFRDCMATLKETGMADAIKETVNKGTPFLGICLGMQVLMTRSYEFGVHAGLNLIEGEVKAFPEEHVERGFKIPHMGWNDMVLPQGQVHPVLSRVKGEQVYYVHSYYCTPRNPEHLLAACSYGDYPFASVIGRDNILGMQFHPEKSQDIGLNLLQRFIGWKP